MQIRPLMIIALCLVLASCQESPDYEPASKELEDLVSKGPIGGDADSWIEMKNSFDEWEKVGLIFGYYGDQEECQKALKGLKAENFQREYRCRPANKSK